MDGASLSDETQSNKLLQADVQSLDHGQADPQMNGRGAAPASGADLEGRVNAAQQDASTQEAASDIFAGLSFS